MESDITMPQTEFPKIIEDPVGDTYVLADAEQDARAEAEGYYGDDEVYGIEYVGWMGRVPYPEDYSSREEWEQSIYFREDWWEGMQAPVNDKQRAHLKQAWRVRFS